MGNDGHVYFNYQTCTSIGKLAQKNSIRKWAAKRDGEFGFFGYGMHGEIGKKALTMKVGDLAGPVEIKDELLGDGFSIFEVIAKKEKRVKPFEEAKAQVEKDIHELKQNNVMTQFLIELRQKYQVAINEGLLANIRTTDDLGRGRKVEMFVVPRF